MHVIHTHTHTHTSLLMAFRFAVASSSVWPPERNMIPGRAGGMVLRSAATVCSAICSGVGFPAPGPRSAPGMTIWGLRRQPSNSTPWCQRRETVAERTFSVTWGWGHRGEGTTVVSRGTRRAIAGIVSCQAENVAKINPRTSWNRSIV
jgi:hypothetical protein